MPMMPAGSLTGTPPTVGATVTIRLFAAAREAAGTGELLVAPGPASEVVAGLVAALPGRFADVLAVSTLISSGHRLDRTSPMPIGAGAVIDVLPPFAGG